MSRLCQVDRFCRIHRLFGLCDKYCFLVSTYCLAVLVSVSQTNIPPWWQHWYFM